MTSMHWRGPGCTSDKYEDVRACFVFVDQELLERFQPVCSVAFPFEIPPSKIPA